MGATKSRRLRWWEWPLLWLCAPLLAAIIKLLTLTCRVVRVVGRQRDLETVSRHRGRAVYCTWHQRMFYHFHYFGIRHVTMMISRSRDGEWAAMVATALGFKNVRGSSRKGSIDKGGSEAWRQIAERVKDGESAGMLVDGPQGPPRVAKIGAVLVAGETGVPLIPEMWGCDRAWVLNTWDRFIIPKPFARVCIIHDEPIYVPSNANQQELERYRKLLQQRMNDTARRCDEYFDVARPTCGG